MMLTTATMNELVERVNCYGIGAWLARIMADLDLALPPAAGQAAVTLPRRAGLLLTIDVLRPVPESGDVRDSFYISLAEGDDTVPMPLDLATSGETPESARARLSPSTTGGSSSELATGDRRVSHFMAGGRVVELRFKPGLVGFDRIIIARLGETQDWRDPSSR